MSSFFIPCFAMAATGFVVYQAVKSSPSERKKEVNLHRNRVSFDHQFNTRGMQSLHLAKAKIVNTLHDMVIINLLGENHKITSKRLSELVENRNVVLV